MSNTRTVWTYEQMDMLYTIYPYVQTRDFAEYINKTQAAVMMRATKFKVKKAVGFKVNHSEEVVEAKRQRQLGKKRGPLSEQHRFNLSRAQPNYGHKQLTNTNEAARKSVEYKIWREKVFARDDYTCQICNMRGGRLNADHIKPFALFKDLRYDTDNGRTLCIDCHKRTPTYGKRLSELQASYGNTF